MPRIVFIDGRRTVIPDEEDVQQPTDNVQNETTPAAIIPGTAGELDTPGAQLHDRIFGTGATNAATGEAVGVTGATDLRTRLTDFLGENQEDPLRQWANRLIATTNLGVFEQLQREQEAEEEEDTDDEYDGDVDDNDENDRRVEAQEPDENPATVDNLPGTGQHAFTWDVEQFRPQPRRATGSRQIGHTTMNITTGATGINTVSTRILGGNDEGEDEVVKPKKMTMNEAIECIRTKYNANFDQHKHLAEKEPKTVFKEPEPVFENEEAIINYAELADKYATMQLIQKYGSYKLEDVQDEYNNLLNYHTLIILDHKRSVNA